MIKITYSNFEGEISSREISEVSLGDGDYIDAYCHDKSQRRTLKIERIIDAVDLSSGEVIEDVWAYFNKAYNSDGTRRFESILAPIIHEIKALKYFCLQVRAKRGFAANERNIIVEFIKGRIEISDDLIPALDEWLKMIWCGNYKLNQDQLYIESLKRISADMKKACRETAFKIALGSGRKPIGDDVIRRIEKEFPY